MNSAPSSASKVNQSVDRALDTLIMLRSSSMTITEVSRELAVHPSTALRLLGALETKQFVKRLQNGAFALGPRLIDLGYAAIENIDLRQSARPYLEGLAAATGEAVHLAILSSDNSVFYIDKVDSKHPVRMYSRIGLSAPLHCTGVGKALLVGLPESSRDLLFETYVFKKFTEKTRTSKEAFEQDIQRFKNYGFVLDDSEHETGIHCIASPVFYHDHTLAGAVSISAPESRVSKSELLAFASTLQDSVREIQRSIGLT